MTFAILAAGEGSRLEHEGVREPKPLIRIGGECLIDRLIRIFLSCGADRICVVVNSRRPEVKAHLESLRCPELHIVVADTPSSMHSLRALVPVLGDEPFVLTTVDTVFREEDFRRYLSEGDFAVTPWVDDEKPLWIDTDADGFITAFRDEGPCPYVSGGIYRLTSPMMQVLGQCIERGEARMRNFQRALLAAGFRLRAFPMERILDIDHRADIVKAESFLSHDILLVHRSTRFTKGRPDDRLLLEAVGRILQEEGFRISETSEERLTEEILRRPLRCVLSMARSEEALALLANCPWPVVNAPDAVRRASCRSDEGAPAPCWVKRNGYAEDPSDVVFAPTEAARQQAVRAMRARGISDIVCQRHREGREVKFYGVGRSFFRPEGLTALRDKAFEATAEKGLEIWGGDAVIGAGGDIHIIDLNDWPSFSSCREEAAKAIAHYALHQK